MVILISQNKITDFMMILECACPFNPSAAEFSCVNHGDQSGFFQFEIIINIFLNRSDSFEYLCYVSTAIRNIFYFFSAGID